MNQLVLKENDTFIVSNEDGNIPDDGGPLGLYRRDTRYLSIYEMHLEGLRPELLSSSSEFNFMGNLQFANPGFPTADGRVVLPHTISIRRNRFIKDGCHERIGFYNYNREPVRLRLTLTFGADFRDIMDVRGFRRTQRGDLLPPEVNGALVRLGYRGRDGVERHTAIAFDRAPTEVRVQPPERADERFIGTTLPDDTEPREYWIVHPPRVVCAFDLALEPRQPTAITLHITAEEHAPAPADLRFDAEIRRLRSEYDAWLGGGAIIRTDNALFNDWLERGLRDLRILTAEQPTGRLPEAGIPWFACPFGRDSLITAFETLLFDPNLAVGTLRFLAAHQGTRVDPERDEEPGKILHELRRGEMARLGESPFSRYYGSVDSTPLFLMLFAETMRWLDDDDLYAELLPAAKRALEWLDTWGDADGDGYIEYATRAAHGLRNQGWKDSATSLRYPDGRLVEPPAALVEVQGYAYAARAWMAELLRRRGETAWADELDRRAAELKRRFNADFWLPEERFYAQALDPAKRPVPIVTSNPGHCLLTGIVDADKVAPTAARLVAPDMACGWGIRTMSAAMPDFNPMSYHNGSIWPHDNALIIDGLARQGEHQAAEMAITQLFDASLRFRYRRLPEVYCGFDRDLRYFSVPAEYPRSCSPQAWAAGSVVLLVQAMLGLRPDAAGGRLSLDPHLPPWLREVTVENLRLGDHRVDLAVRVVEGRPRVELVRSDGNVSLMLGRAGAGR